MKLQKGYTDSIDSIRKEVSRAIEAGSTAEITQMLGKLQLMSETIPIQHRILRKLMVEDAKGARRSQIHEASGKTCGWILGDDNNTVHGDESESGESESDESEGDESDSDKMDQEHRLQTSLAFRRWLREGKNIQHISGNAGAGKSTLVSASHFLSNPLA